MRRSGAVSLLLLLAFALLPAAAVADSANDQYTEPLPDATGNSGGGTDTSTGTGGSGPSGGGAGGGAPGGGSGGGAPSGGSASGGSAAGSAAAGGEDAGGSGSGGTAADSPGTAAAAAEDVDGAGQGAAALDTAAGDPASATADEDDGSFPTLAVVLGVLALIALSTGAAILYNRRRDATAGSGAQA